MDFLKDVFIETMASAMRSNYNDTKKRKLAEAKFLVLFGVGEFAHHIKRQLEDSNLPYAYCDFNESLWDTEIDGVKVLSFAQLSRLQRDGLLVGITSGRGVIAISKLSEIGISNYIDFTVESEPLHLMHYNHDLIMKNLDGLKQTYDWFEDELSKQTMLSIFQYRITGDAAYLPPVDDNSYFHLLVRPRLGDVIIDGGAYIGDTAIPFAKHLKNQCTIYSFEPGEENYNALLDNIKNEEMENICYPIKAGLWDENTVIKINAEQGKGVHVVAEGISIAAITLDTFVKDKSIQPDLIKLDVEGAEENVILGAVETIYKYRPRLQICLYHKANDFWTIPQLIKRIEPRYRFYFAHHDNRLCESVLYAIFDPYK